MACRPNVSPRLLCMIHKLRTLYNLFKGLQRRRKRRRKWRKRRRRKRKRKKKKKKGENRGKEGGRRSDEAMWCTRSLNDLLSGLL